MQTQLTLEQEFQLETLTLTFQVLSDEDKIKAYKVLLFYYLHQQALIRQLYKEKLLGGESFIP